jgi:hypothetical protein
MILTIQQTTLKKVLQAKAPHLILQIIPNLTGNMNKNIKIHHTKDTNNTIEIKDLHKKTIPTKILIIIKNQINNNSIKEIIKQDKENLLTKDIKNSIKSKINNTKKNIIVNKHFNKKESETN